MNRAPKLSASRDHLRRAARILIAQHWHPELRLSLQRCGVDPDAPLQGALITLPLKLAGTPLPTPVLSGLQAIGAVEPTDDSGQLCALSFAVHTPLPALRGLTAPVIPVDWTALELVIAGQLWEGDLRFTYQTEGRDFTAIHTGHLGLLQGLEPQRLSADRKLAANLLLRGLTEVHGSTHAGAVAEHLRSINKQRDHPALADFSWLSGVMEAPSGQASHHWGATGLNAQLKVCWSRQGQAQLTAYRLELTLIGETEPSGGAWRHLLSFV